MKRHLEIDKEKTLSSNKLTKGNMLKYFEQRKAKQRKMLEAEFNKAYKQFMKEERINVV